MKKEVITAVKETLVDLHVLDGWCTSQILSFSDEKSEVLTHRYKTTYIFSYALWIHCHKETDSR